MNECQNISVHSDESICFAIVDTVSNLTNTDPLELDPLGTVVDTDALNALFSPSDSSRRHDAYLTFRYEGCNVAVDSDGTISVDPVAATVAVDDGISSATEAESAVGSSGDGDYR